LKGTNGGKTTGSRQSKKLGGLVHLGESAHFIKGPRTRDSSNKVTCGKRERFPPVYRTGVVGKGNR